MEITLRGGEFQSKGSFIRIYLPSTDSLNDPELKSFHKSLLSAFISLWIKGERMIRGHRSKKKKKEVIDQDWDAHLPQ